ncbi:MAG: hypothetical protein GWO38_15175, partial [Phycisphaerae bacterium]|nr:hypothetical protein [Phycisphaerae bacterium]NIX28927.1 hypothetical protein [Phycisphaerae bacterium]
AIASLAEPDSPLQSVCLSSQDVTTATDALQDSLPFHLAQFGMKNFLGARRETQCSHHFTRAQAFPLEAVERINYVSLNQFHILSQR